MFDTLFGTASDAPQVAIEAVEDAYEYLDMLLTPYEEVAEEARWAALAGPVTVTYLPGFAPAPNAV